MRNLRAPCWGLHRATRLWSRLSRQTAADYLGPDCTGARGAAGRHSGPFVRGGAERGNKPAACAGACGGPGKAGARGGARPGVDGNLSGLCARAEKPHRHPSERQRAGHAGRSGAHAGEPAAWRGGKRCGEKYSFVRATDAEQIARAQELEAQGENAKTIWSETHLTRDGGGAWVQEINDQRRKAAPGRRRAGRNGRPPCGLSGAPGAVRGCAGYSGYKRKIGNAVGKRKGEIFSAKKECCISLKIRLKIKACRT